MMDADYVDYDDAENLEPTDMPAESPEKKELNGNSNPQYESWDITKMDRALDSTKAAAVVDHAKAALFEKRVCEAGERLDISRFGTTLARFANSEIRLDKRLARGNFSDIYTIKDFSPSQSFKSCTEEEFYAAETVKKTCRANEVVVKILRAKLVINPALFASGIADLITEATLLAALDHPNVVSMKGRSINSIEGFTSGKRDGFFIILERLHGTLVDGVKRWKERSAENGVMRRGIKGMQNFRLGLLLERILDMTQLADAMAYIHDRNIIHRDLKQNNVGIDSAGRVKLCDFGLARVLPETTSDKERFLLTANTGSLRYMAPEIGRGEKYNLVRRDFADKELGYLPSIQS
jgi:serine/threonine protein kinase